MRPRLEPIDNVIYAVTDEAFSDAHEFRTVAARAADLQELHADAKPCGNFFGRERFFGVKVCVD